MLKIFVDYPTREEELKILERYTIRSEPSVENVVSKDEVIALQMLCRDIPVSDELKSATVNLVLATRKWEGAHTELAQGHHWPYPLIQSQSLPAEVTMSQKRICMSSPIPS